MSAMNRAFLKNVLGVGSMQAAQYILPFVTVPYLSRTLQPAGFGLMIYALSIAGFLAIVCDYSFSYTAMQSAAAQRDNVDAVRHIFTAVTAAKASIFLACVLAFSILIVVVPHLREHWKVHLLALLGTFGSVLFPTWLFQALQKFTQMAWLSISGRAISVVALFLFVRAPSDVWLAVLMQTFPISGLAALILTRHWLGNSLPLPRWSEVRHQLRTGWRVFASMSAVNLYTGAQTVLVGALGGITAAGYYGAADKCLTAAKAGFGVLAQSALPQVAYLAKHQPDAGLRFISRLLMTFPIGLAASACMYFFAEPFVRLLFGAEFIPGVVPLFHILSPIPFTMNLSVCFATLFMFNYGFQRQWSHMLIAASSLAIGSLALLQFVMPVQSAAAVAALLAEILVLLVSGAYYCRAVMRMSYSGFDEMPIGAAPTSAKRVEKIDS
jgi:polysaccharide transporter, PST family